MKNSMKMKSSGFIQQLHIESQKKGEFFEKHHRENLRKEFYFPAHVLRVTLLKKGRIVFEYDIPSKKLLKRKEALSKKVYTQTLKKYREVLDVEVKSPAPRTDKDVWLISDTHFDHENIIKYCARPFANVKEMNEILCRNWNGLIAKNSQVYFLGDMSFGRRSRSSRYWLSRLNGEVRYISGNHEKEIWNEYDTISYNGYDFLLLHDPKDRKEFPDFDGWVIHGHIHNNNLKKYPFINWKERTVNVCVEVLNYKPLKLEKLVEILNLRLEENLETILDVSELISKQ